MRHTVAYIQFNGIYTDLAVMLKKKTDIFQKNTK